MTPCVSTSYSILSLRRQLISSIINNDAIDSHFEQFKAISLDNDKEVEILKETIFNEFYFNGLTEDDLENNNKLNIYIDCIETIAREEKQND